MGGRNGAFSRNHFLFAVSLAPGGTSALGDVANCSGSNYRLGEATPAPVTAPLDYFGAQHFSNNIGRFISADEFDNNSEPANPQSWNLYSYTRNNPLRYVDPDGKGTLDFLLGEGKGIISFAGTAIDAVGVTAIAVGTGNVDYLAKQTGTFLSDSAHGNLLEYGVMVSHTPEQFLTLTINSGMKALGKRSEARGPPPSLIWRPGPQKLYHQ
jgi:RHS repeat-associated protein